MCRYLSLLLFLFSAFTFSHAARAEQVALLSEATEAASARLEAIRNAKYEIYFSSYILRNDSTSLMLLAALKDAAARGVKVRMVIDAHGNTCDRRVLAALARSGVHIELFKPWFFSIFGSYLNRMHDKLLVIDQIILFIGDRNAGAEYYNYHRDLAKRAKAFISRDLIVIGAVAKQVTAYIRELISHKITEPQSFRDVSQADVNAGYRILNEAFGQIPTRYLEAATKWKSRLVEAKVYFSSDKPGAKGSQPGTYETVIAGIDSAKTSILIENPYIVLTEEMRYSLRQAAERGVKITVLTNSVSSTDSLLVAGGWVESREFFAHIGASVYEIKGDVLSTSERFKKLFRIASSKASLHSKTMIIDGRVPFVMSFNMDPRSAFKNSEVALHVESSALARMLNGDIGKTIRLHAKKVVTKHHIHADAQDCGRFVRFLARVLHEQL